MRFLFSGGNRNDICMAQALLEPFDLSGKLILADRGYNSGKFIRWVEERGGMVVIPSRVNAKCPGNTDWHTCKERHLIEKLFLKLKNHRRFLPDMGKKPAISLPLYPLCASSFGYFDRFQTPSNTLRIIFYKLFNEQNVNRFLL